MNGKRNVWTNPVFVVPIILVISLAVWGFISPLTLEGFANSTYGFLTNNFGWFYTGLMTVFVVFSIWLGVFSKYKNIKLGDDEDLPEYNNLTWFAMLFSAGMGIGLVFYGAAEPVNHFINAPGGIEPYSAAAKTFAMDKSFLHWGLHPWANYSIVGLALAYAQFRLKKPALISSVFQPLIEGKSYENVLSHTVDGLAVFATVAGMATSLGLGTLQISAGLNYLFNIPITNMLLIVIVVIITIIYTGTAVLGIDKGISVISNLNMVFVGVLTIGTLLLGPTANILGTFIETSGSYLDSLAKSAVEMGVFSESNWYANWTIYYWAWWIAWAPFTGTFIARISKGRTIKEFVSGVLLVPTIVSFAWFAIFGGSALTMPDDFLTGAAADITTTLFEVFERLPLGFVLSVVTILLLFTFFITSANSATFVLGMLSEHGNQNPTKSVMGIWGVVMSALGLGLMLGTENGLQMLQTISLVGGFPFALVMIGLMIAMVKLLNKDPSANQNKVLIGNTISKEEI